MTKKQPRYWCSSALPPAMPPRTPPQPPQVQALYDVVADWKRNSTPFVAGLLDKIVQSALVEGIGCTPFKPQPRDAVWREVHFIFRDTEFVVTLMGDNGKDGDAREWYHKRHYFNRDGSIKTLKDG